MFYLDLIFKNIKIIGIGALILLITYLIASNKLKSKDLKFLNTLISKKDILIKERDIKIKNNKIEREIKKEIYKTVENIEKTNNKETKKILKEIDDMKDGDYNEITL